jgi:hypothetical protein
MSRGYWRAIAAIVGLLVGVFSLGVLVAWVMWPGNASLPTYEWNKTAYSEYQPGGASCQPARIKALLTDRERARKRETCEEATEQHRIDTNDLKQQTRAADAAAAAVIVAEWQAKATVLGLIIGLYTLLAAVAAAFFAKQAADETKRSANAAENAVAESARIGEAQVRCYLTVEKVEIEINAARNVCVTGTIRNSGQSPALDVSWEFRLSIIKNDVVRRSEDIKGSQIDSVETIPVQGEHTFLQVLTDFGLSQDDLTHLGEQGSTLAIGCRVIAHATDVFGRDVRSERNFISVLQGVPAKVDKTIMIPIGRRVDKQQKDEKN